MSENSPSKRFKKVRFALSVAAALSALQPIPAVPAGAASDKESTAFLDIPVGGRPAAMGGAYSALAVDAYAPNLNPGGLGFLSVPQVSGQHLSYVESVRYEYLSFGVPLRKKGASVGGSVQYLSAGGMEGSDGDGGAAGGFSSHFAAYNLSYGKTVTERLSLGVTGKVIEAAIAGVPARAYAVDLGAMYKVTPAVTAAAVAGNWGSELKFIEQGDPLPSTARLGLAWQPSEAWSLSAEAVHRPRGDASGHAGLEFRPAQALALRLSYRTDAAGGGLGGVTAGFGLSYQGGEFSYAWLPVGELGSVHYFSIGIRFNGAAKARRSPLR